ncbi:MAG: RiPP maturation radical SAM C-methyltransferase [Syntrophobacterales bacterium]
MGTFRLALISMPWPLANRPSIQLATLKSFLREKAPEVEADCYHPYLQVGNLLGIQAYNNIAERTWMAEAIYGYLLNPKKRVEILDLFRTEHASRTKKDPPDLKTISSQIQRLHQRHHFAMEWSSYDLVGFSICLSQLTSSLYMIKQIRARHPGCRIVVGGSSCAGELGYSLLANLPEIDFVVSGEGELPLLELINRIKNDDLQGDESSGLLWRDEQGNIRGGELKQLPDLNDLPVPEYRDYFDELSRQPRLANLVPSLPLETSRGCWWHRVKKGAVERACKFCNLNLQWRGYRSKEPLQVAREMEELAAQYASLKFFFVDNILDNNKLLELFRCINDGERDFEIFTELRASASRSDLIQMRRTGVTQVQVGIEALSTRLLRKINKGTTAIQNIEIPGSDEEDVAETLNNLRFVLPFRPLRKVRFWLGQNSPVALYPEKHGIRSMRNHPHYQRLLPDSLANSLCLMVKTYVGDRTRQKNLWRPVAREIERWQQRYESLRRQHFPAPLLSYRDGGDFLLIRRRGEGSEMETFRLRGSSRAIYRFCETRRTLGEIRRKFPRFSSDKLQTFISHMVGKRLMFREGRQVLSLAVNEEPHRMLCGEDT